jgi:hypothetical protein
MASTDGNVQLTQAQIDSLLIETDFTKEEIQRSLGESSNSFVTFVMNHHCKSILKCIVKKLDVVRFFHPIRYSFEQ